jgi:hypothetical protein
MDLFKGKSASERNKMIAAIVLGVLAISALAFAFLPGLFSSSTKVNASVTVSPKPVSNNQQTVSSNFQMPSQADQNFDYATTAISYSPGSYGAPAPGRNIFAFYEPPPPTPYSPTPVVINTPKPTPTPTPFPYQIAAVMPQAVYAGQRAFKLEVIGDGFEPDTKIYFNQSLMPTSYLGPQRLTADIPANMIAAAGGKQVIVSSPDGQKYSQQQILQVQQPPTPQQQYEYVGMISRKFANNDTAYFMEKSKLNTPGAAPTGKRLNDLLAGRFRLISINEKEAQFEDVNLGFKHKMPILRQSSGGSPGSPSGFPNFPNGARPQNSTGFPNGFPGFPNMTTPQQPRPNNANRPDRRVKKDDDDEDDDDTDN